MKLPNLAEITALGKPWFASRRSKLPSGAATLSRLVGTAFRRLARSRLRMLPRIVAARHGHASRLVQ